MISQVMSGDRTHRTIEDIDKTVSMWAKETLKPQKRSVRYSFLGFGFNYACLLIKKIHLFFATKLAFSHIPLEF